MSPLETKSKKRPLKNLIIYALVSEWPLTVRKIYNKLKSNNGIDVTYQAVFKTVKELVEKDVLVEKNKKYMINIGWINMVRDIADMMKKRYLSASGESEIPRDVYFPDPRVTMFLSEVGKKIVDYLKDSEGCVIAIGGGGINFGLGVKYYLSNKGIEVNYCEMDRHKIHMNRMLIRKKDVERRKVLVVDSAINTGETMKKVMKKMNSIKKDFRIKDVKYAAGCDLAGMVDWCATRKPYLPVSDKGVLSIFW
jgi:orotate phosphoribosyltransferase-like protein